MHSKNIFKILAAKIFILWSCSTIAGGIPVIDAANVSQSTISAIENVAQTLKQLEQYQLQLQQYEDQLRNTAAPAVYVWDKANQTISSVLSKIDTLNYYKQQAGSIDSYLSKFQKVSYYRSAQCFGQNGCTPKEMEKLNESETLGSASQKQANDAVIKGLEEQQTQLIKDASSLEQLQKTAESAEGRMQAIQAANQLASHQSAQLLQIRSLLVQQQAAEVARSQMIMDREAKAQAAHEQALKGKFTKSPVKEW